MGDGVRSSPSQHQLPRVRRQQQKGLVAGPEGAPPGPVVKQEFGLMLLSCGGLMGGQPGLLQLGGLLKEVVVNIVVRVIDLS